MKRITTIISALILAVSFLMMPNCHAENMVYQPGYNEFTVNMEAYLNGTFYPSYKSDNDTIETIWYTRHSDVIEIQSSPYSPSCTAYFKKAGYGELVLSVKYWYNYVYYLPNSSGLGIGTWHSERMQGVNVITYKITVKDPLPKNNTVDFAGGSGTIADPYLISTARQLMNIELTQPYMNAHYKLINDIVLSDADYEKGGVCYNEGLEIWAPLGLMDFLNYMAGSSTLNGVFYGVFDGDGYTISGLRTYFSHPLPYAPAPVGLFANNGGTIKNLGIVGSEFVSFSQTPGSYNRTGCFAGVNIGTISNCYAKGNYLAGDVVGGICGVNQQSGQILDCYTIDNKFTGTPDSKRDSIAGGIAGYHTGGSINRTYSSNYVWAINFDDELYYPDFYGAIAGAIDDYDQIVSVTNSYYSPNLDTAVFYDWTTKSDSTISATKLSFAQMANLANYAGFSSSTWYVDPNSDYKYPQLYNSRSLSRALYMTSTPSKNIYKIGETLDLSGASFTEVFTDGSSETFLLDHMNIVYGAQTGLPENATVYVEGFDNQTTAMQVLTLTYRGLSVQFEVYVYEGELVDETNKASRPAASPASGFIAKGGSVTLSCAMDEAYIFYTTDGTTPTIHSTLYQEPIPVTEDVTIRAIVAVVGLEVSNILTASYCVIPDAAFAAMITDNSLSKSNERLGGAVTIQVNNNKIAVSTDIMLAIYDATGRLSFMDKQNTPLSPGINEISFNGISVANAQSQKYTARVFVWDGVGSMTPLNESDTLIVWED